MYRVLYVEDEILERENQRESWIWNTGEYQLCADAANGKDAWEKLQQMYIDILITDIKMPFMDGISLSKLVREHMPHIKIIILSGYSEFSYAQQALGIGVAEYIVKPIRSSDLLEALRKVSKQIADEATKNQRIIQLQQQAELNKPAQIQKLLEDLSLGIFSADVIEAHAHELGIDIRAKYYIAAVIEYAEYKLLLSHADQLRALDVQETVYGVVKGDQTIYLFHHELQDIRLIFMGEDPTRLKTKATIILREINESLKHVLPSVKAVLSMGDVREGYDGIAASLADAKLLLNFKYLYTDREILVMEKSVINEINGANGRDLTLNVEKAIMENLIKFGSKEEVDGFIHNLTEKMASMHYSLMFYQYTCIDIIKTLEHFLKELGESDMRKTLKNDEDPFSIDAWLKWSDDIGAFAQYLKKTLCQIIDIREQKKNYKYNNIIAEARKYIDEHYCDMALNLNSVASHVNISSSYFSTLFSQEMGESFIEYLTRRRIERAKELLKTTSMRLTDIAFEIGYQDSNYFSKIFKRLTNETPREYRG